MSDKNTAIIDIDNLKKYKLCIATPMYGGNSQAMYVTSLIDLAYTLGKYGLHYQFRTIWNEALITRARSALVKEFLSTDCDILFFIDSDIGFDPYNVLHMMDIMVNSDDKKIICGIYPKKLINWKHIDAAHKNNFIKNPEDAELYSSSFVVNFDNGENKHTTFNVKKPVKIKQGGTGFMMIHREVFEKFKDAYPEQNSKEPEKDEDIFYYFDCKIDPKSKIYLSEDFMFCDYARNIGYDTWALPWVYLSHSGTYTHKGSFADDSIMYYELYVKDKNNNIEK